MQTRLILAVVALTLLPLLQSCSAGDSPAAGNSCSAANPTGACPNGQACLNGQCCSTPCGSSCCSGNAMCLQDSAGNARCAQLCAKNSDCPSATNCCSDVPGSTNRACIAYAPGAKCSCQNNSDCTAVGTNTACAPQVSNDIIQSRTYICKPNDALAWNGCNPGAGSCCPTNYDCRGDSNGNRFCARTCSSNSQCGNPGVACCSTAGCFNCVSSCSSGGCMACP